MQNVVKEIPSGLHNMFFKAFPVAIAIQDTWVSNDKFSTFITDIAAINPLYGFIILFREGWNLKGATITHPGYLMAASVAGGFTVVELASIIAKGGDRTANLIRFALSPAYTVRDTLGMATRAAQNTYRFVNASAYLQAEGRMEVAKMASAVGRNKLRS